MNNVPLGVVIIHLESLPLECPLRDECWRHCVASGCIGAERCHNTGLDPVGYRLPERSME